MFFDNVHIYFDLVLLLFILRSIYFQFCSVLYSLLFSVLYIVKSIYLSICKFCHLLEVVGFHLCGDTNVVIPILFFPFLVCNLNQQRNCFSCLVMHHHFQIFVFNSALASMKYHFIRQDIVHNVPSVER